MNKFFSPSSQEIFIEVNGVKLAVVESYEVESSQNTRLIRAFGQTQPVAVAKGSIRHALKLSRVALCLEDATHINFYDIHNFNLVIAKPNKRIIYSGCEWASIKESASIAKGVFEQVEIFAANRMEIT